MDELKERFEISELTVYRYLIGDAGFVLDRRMRCAVLYEIQLK